MTADESSTPLLATIEIDSSVRAQFPDYSALVILANELSPGPSTPNSDALLAAAETDALAAIGAGTAQDLPEVQRWRGAYKEFGVRPRDARSSIEALLRRVGHGLPRIDRLTDTYNAMSVRHRVPIGGEDVHGYQGAARLVTADGGETFDTVVDGEPAEVTVSPGEIVWRDDVGVTCRRWNWRQCTRTRLTEATTDAIFIIDSLGEDSAQRARAAGDDLIQALLVDSPGAVFAKRLLGAGDQA